MSVKIEDHIQIGFKVYKQTEKEKQKNKQKIILENPKAHAQFVECMMEVKSLYYGKLPHRNF